MELIRTLQKSRLWYFKLNPKPKTLQGSLVCKKASISGGVYECCVHRCRGREGLGRGLGFRLERSRPYLNPEEPNFLIFKDLYKEIIIRSPKKVGSSGLR